MHSLTVLYVSKENRRMEGYILSLFNQTTNLTPPDGGASWLTIWSRSGLVDFGGGPFF